jgi:energy-converting hydrogenase Eha subunit A
MVIKTSVERKSGRNLMRQAIDSGRDIDLLALLEAANNDGIIPVLPPIFDRQRARCIRKGWARSVVYGTEITAVGRDVLRDAMTETVDQQVVGSLGD